MQEQAVYQSGGGILSFRSSTNIAIKVDMFSEMFRKKMDVAHRGEPLNDLLSWIGKCKAGWALPLQGNIFELKMVLGEKQLLIVGKS